MIDAFGFSFERFQTAPVVGIIRKLSPEIVQQMLPVYVESRLTTLEITMNTPDAASIIADARRLYAGRLNIGAGTVCSMQDLDHALAAGAQFIVTPVMNQDVITACVEQKIPVFPGAFSPSEIYQAWRLGATMVKVYPAATLGPDYLRHIKAPLEQIRLLPTGGINLQNIDAFIQAGAEGVGVGSPLFIEQFIRSRDWNALLAHFKTFARKFSQLP